MTANVRSIVFVWLLLLCGMATAAPRVDGVLARGQDDQFWLLKTEVADDNAVTTSVRQLADPVAGTWAEANRLGGRVVDAAALGDRLAVLQEGGAWRVLWPDGGVAGPAPPEGWSLNRFASSGDALWALAGRSNEPAGVLRWTENDGWKVIAVVPPEVDAAKASLGVINDQAWLAWTKDGVARVARWRPNRTWQTLERTWPGVETIAFVSGSPFPLLATRSGDQLTFARLATEPNGATSGPAPITVTGPAEATVVGPGLRVIDVKDGVIQQTVIDDFGTGARHGPSPVPDPAPPQPAQRFEWFNVLVLTLLTVIMLRNLRSDPAGPPVAAAGLRLAPLWRRTAAGLLDALPLVITAAWVAWGFGGTAEELKRASELFYLPIYLALLAYVAHVTASEIWFGRSFGKWIFRLKVVALDGTPATTGAILLRNALRVLDFSLMLLPILLLLISPSRQRLGDLAARTVVVADGPAKVAEAETPAGDSQN